MTGNETIRLDALALALGVPMRSMERWTTAELIRGRNRGRGRGRGITLTREAAIEAVAIALLRKRGRVPVQRLRPVVKALREMGRKGSDFLALGSDGREVLFDGAGDHVPLRDAAGQCLFGFFFDLRKLREDAARIVEGALA